ncbi:MAG TPA: rod shape-determining protein MreC [Candidatus Paceibacterota bacterium]
MRTGFYKKYITVFLFVLVLFFVNTYATNGAISNFLYKITFESNSFFSDKLSKWSWFADRFLVSADSVERLLYLEEENSRLRGELAEADGIKKENQFLRKQLGVASRSDVLLEVVKIFNIERSNLGSTALIDKGISNKIKIRMPVVAPGNVLIGLVDEVFGDYSRIILLDDPRIKINVRTQESGILAELRGLLKNSASLDLVSAGDKVSVGDSVVTSGLDGLEEFLFVGKVVRAEESNLGLFKEVLVEPEFDLSLGLSVFVILN